MPKASGKTTTINHLLKHRPATEQWAVLVNEYGLIGLDAALMASASEPGQPPGVQIREVAGGCICFSAAFDEVTRREEVQDQVKAADVLLAGRSDLATADQLDAGAARVPRFTPRRRG